MKHKTVEIFETKNNKIVLKGAKNENDSSLRVCKPLMNWSSYFAYICGGAGSGKTSMLIQLLTDPQCYRYKFDQIHLFSPSAHTLQDSFISLLDPSRIHRDLDDLELIIESLKGSEDKVLFVFDDCVQMISDKNMKKIIMGMAFNRRHLGKGLSCFVVSQSFRKIDLGIRSAFDSIFYFNLSNKRENEAIFEDSLSNFLERDQFDALVKHAKKEPYPFIYCDMKNSKVYSKFNKIRFIGDEVDEIQS